jgi:membrane protein DedA with SNARE-associated domain
MLRRIVGFILGGIVIWLILTLGEAITPDTQPRYLLAIIIGLIVAGVYPWLIGLYLVRRHRAKQDEEIQAEVQRQLAEERSRQNPG